MITDPKEREILQYLLRTRKWNPYCIRHFAITYDLDSLPEFALKKKVRWSMNSKQPARYIKRRMGNNLKMQILQREGIELDNSIAKPKPAVMSCPRCSETNPRENKFCSKCSYPLVVIVVSILFLISTLHNLVIILVPMTITIPAFIIS
jgi:hypothetical protein